MLTRHPPPSPSSVADTLLNPESADSWSGYPVSNGTDDILIGTTLLDTYQVDRVLGEGGMGRIYEAHHTRIAERRFAIKVLRPELVKNPHSRARFEREVEAVARVTHPGVLTIADVGTTPLGWPFMVCEHLSGLDLLAYLRRFGALHNDRAVFMGCRIAEALEATHALGVIHRDVKPSNVFLIGSFEKATSVFSIGSLQEDPEWNRVKLIDFGLSRFVGRNDDLTKTGIVMGTPAYMSPEQARGARTDHLTDVYGVGAVLYAAATGSPPFREETQQQTLLAVMNREPVRPRELKSSISEGLEVVIQRAMAKQPEERYPNMSALCAALSRLEPGMGSRLSWARDESPRGVRWRFLALGSVALLLFVGAAVSVVSGLITLSGYGIRLTRTESALSLVVLGAAVVPMLLLLRRFARTWRNTAKLEGWLPRLRTPVLAALVAYGFGSFALRFGGEVIAPFAFGDVLGRAPAIAWPGWSVLLVLVGLLAAVLASIHQRWWQPLWSLRRWLRWPALATALVFASLAIARVWSLWQRDDSVALSEPGDIVGAPSAEAVSNESAMALRESTGVDAGALPAGGVVSLQAADAGRPSSTPSSDAIENVPEPAGNDIVSPGALPLAPAPSDALTAAVAQGTDDLKSPSHTSSEDRNVLKALVLEHASRSSGLTDAVRAIAELLSVAPDKANDPDVRYILTKAASAEGSASREAFAVMGRSMGSAGPDLVYDLMLRKPALFDRAKHRLTRFSTQKLFTPELSIAYDLRFSPSCSSRVWLLERANAIGDQRSINVLSALVPSKCGRRGQPPCLARCQKNSAQFSRSIEIIAERLRARERAAASVN